MASSWTESRDDNSQPVPLPVIGAPGLQRRKIELSTPKSKNITWHEGQVTRDDRQAMLGQSGCTIWLTGLSGSGKSTIAVAAEKALNERGRLTYILDGDNIRMGLNSNLGFSPEDRT